jgi:hypothetical protein
MTRDDICRMAEESTPDQMIGGFEFDYEQLLHFAALVAAAERERIKWDSIHSCHADCQNPACVIVREAVAAEREACAKVCMDKWMEWMDAPPDKRLDMRNDAEDCAFAIRERGAP